jgi:hypothetical protein
LTRNVISSTLRAIEQGEAFGRFEGESDGGLELLGRRGDLLYYLNILCVIAVRDNKKTTIIRDLEYL